MDECGRERVIPEETLVSGEPGVGSNDKDADIEDNVPRILS